MLIRHYKPNTRLDHFELDGLITALNNRIEDMTENGEAVTPYYQGALLAVEIFRFHEFVETQDDFLRLFDKYVNDIIEKEIDDATIQ